MGGDRPHEERRHRVPDLALDGRLRPREPERVRERLEPGRPLRRPLPSRASRPDVTVGDGPSAVRVFAPPPRVRHVTSA